MKILINRSETNSMRLIFELMRQIKFEVGDHKRHWISEFQYLKIQLPHPDEQRKITDVLVAIDSKIGLVSKQIAGMQAFKEGLVQQMFV
jgi:type I restriction enzyme, S subunit